MFFINPFILSPAGGDFESIATVMVGSGGAANIEFTSIPGTYQHLQVRMITRTARAANLDAVNVRVGNGSVDTGNNYAHHYLYGDGASAGAGGAATQSFAYIAQSIAANSTAGMFGAFGAVARLRASAFLLLFKTFHTT
jgi:hypothetical protein